MLGHRNPCDLHLHSHFSDGNLSPAELVRRAKSAGLSAVSITDHDTLLGQAEALEAGERYGVEVLTGIEFSITEDNVNLHILGYCFDPNDRILIESLGELSSARIDRARLIVSKLAERGIDVPFDGIMRDAGDGTVGRPHIAKAMLRNGFVGTIHEAFYRYLGDSSPCYVPKTVFPRQRVVDLISGAGGVAVWAHPGSNIRRKALLDLVCETGVAGLEVWHPNHSTNIERDIRAAAAQRGLIQTGGSDFHFREAMQADIGEVTCPYDAVRALKLAAGN
jgi:predicted metal-dependent phosphoesterase TrpH